VGVSVGLFEEIYDWVALYERFWTNKLSALGEHLKKRS